MQKTQKLKAGKQQIKIVGRSFMRTLLTLIKRSLYALFTLFLRSLNAKLQPNQMFSSATFLMLFYDPSADVVVALIFTYLSFQSIRSFWQNRREGMSVGQARVLRSISWQAISCLVFWIQFIKNSGLWEKLTSFFNF